MFVSMALFLGFANLSCAQEQLDLPDPGITPESPFYFLDKLGEQVGMMMTFGDEQAKLEKQMQNIQERLSEMNQLQTEGKTEIIEGMMGDYNKQVSQAAQEVAKAAQSKEGFSEALNNLIATTNGISQTVLTRVYEQVPEQAKSAIQSAIEAANGDMEGAIKSMQQNQLEKAQGLTDDALQKARDNAPEAAKQYIPSNIDVKSYVNDVDVKKYTNPEAVVDGNYVDPNWQEDFKKDMEDVNRQVKEATNQQNLANPSERIKVDVPEINVPDVNVPEIDVPGINRGR